MFCNHCGSVIPTDAAVCPNCQAHAIAVSQKTPRVRNHLTLLAALWFAMGALRLFAALVLFGIVSVILPMVEQQQWAPIPFPVPAMMRGIGILVAAVAVLSLAVGWGLYQRASWARMLALVMGFISLLSVPLGTALGIYTLVVLLPAESETEWRQIAQG